MNRFGFVAATTAPRASKHMSNKIAIHRIFEIYFPTLQIQDTVVSTDIALRFSL